MRPAHEKNFGLTHEEFTRLVTALRRGDETLFELAFLSHFESCTAYVGRQTGANDDQAYDATMEALLTLRRKIIEEKITYGNLRYLLTRIACQLHWKSVRRAPITVALRNSHEQLPDHEPEVTLDDETRRMLDEAWGNLGIDCQTLLRKIFFLGQPINSIAAEEGIQPATLRKRKERCINRLRRVFLKANQ